MKLREWLVVTAVAAVLAGCASGVQREPSEPGAVASRPAQAVKVAGISVSLSPEAQKLVADSPKFDPDKLAATVRRMLEGRGLLVASDAGLPRAEIVVTDFRVRGSFAAVMFGVMAGTDNVTGDVIVRDPAGKMVRKFRVHAVYGLGGFAGGQDDMRLNWMYEKFGEHTTAELAGTPLKE